MIVLSHKFESYKINIYSVGGFTYVKAFIQIYLTSSLFCSTNKTAIYHINAFEYPFNFF
jgi:hypothetical protein